MGYNTYYSMSFKVMNESDDLRLCNHKIPKKAKFCPECGVSTEKPDDVADLIANYIIIEKKKNRDFCYAINEHGSGTDHCTWYNHDDDMKIISKKFPNILFILSGNGEESGDIWKKYYLNGKVQTAKAKITFDEPDFNKFI